jgi:hypothetical protein
MKIQQEQLIDSLKKDVEILLSTVQSFVAEKDALLIQPAPGKWSITQILEHLNMYSRYYIPAIDRAITTTPSTREAWFISGFWGNYFTNMMKPKNVFEVKNKMGAMKSYSPENVYNPDTVINEFIQHQQRLLQLLELSRQKSLNGIKVPISISKMIKLKLGDTFRFFIAHEQRHFIQARNALKTIGLATDKFPVILQAALL